MIRMARLSLFCRVVKKQCSIVLDLIKNSQLFEGSWCFALGQDLQWLCQSESSLVVVDFRLTNGLASLKLILGATMLSKSIVPLLGQMFPATLVRTLRTILLSALLLVLSVSTSATLNSNCPYILLSPMASRTQFECMSVPMCARFASKVFPLASGFSNMCVEAVRYAGVSYFLWALSCLRIKPMSWMNP